MTKEPHFTADYLSELKIPALLLSGENDVIKDSDFTFIQSSLPYCVHKVIKIHHTSCWEIDTIKH